MTSLNETERKIKNVIRNSLPNTVRILRRNKNKRTRKMRSMTVNTEGEAMMA